MKAKSAAPEITCTPMDLPDHMQVEAARQAIAINPMNQPKLKFAADLLPPQALPMTLMGAETPTDMAASVPSPEHLAMLTSKYWNNGGVKLTVGFMEQTSPALRDKILTHMNAWGKFCNVEFSWSQTDPQIRISFGPGGYYSYLGPDNLLIPKNQHTMNLEAFTVNTPESEFVRVVEHETGHVLGFVHEHMRRELVARIDQQKAIAYFMQTQGWTATMVRQQVLTPIEESSLLSTEKADQDSIMCYQLPGSITVDGKPIRGGVNIDPSDKALAAKLYPLPTTPPPPSATTIMVPTAGTYQLVK